MTRPLCSSLGPVWMQKDRPFLPVMMLLWRRRMDPGTRKDMAEKDKEDTGNRTNRDKSGM